MTRCPRLRRALTSALVLMVHCSLGIALTACSSDPTKGYAFGSGHRTDIHTVAVPIFENTTFQHVLEMQLTDAIIKEVHRTTPWRVAPRGSAETVLTGEITSAEIRKLSSQRETGLIQEAAVDLSVNFQWKSVTDGKVLIARKNFRAAQNFVPARGAQERLEFGQSSAIDQMAKDIVAELRSNW